MKKLIIFDFDGVIAKGVDVFFDIYQTLQKKYELKKITSKEKLEEIFAHDAMTAMGMVNAPKLRLPFLFKDYKKLMHEKESEILIYPGIPEAIEKISKENTLMITSSNHTDVIKKVLHHNKILKHFDHISGAEFSMHKTKKLEHALKHFNQKPEDAFLITDTPADVKTAKKLKIHTIAVSWGCHTWKKSDILPDRMVEKPSELPNAIDEVYHRN